MINVTEPLFRLLLTRRRQLTAPLLVGMSAPQGFGKTTIAGALSVSGIEKFPPDASLRLDLQDASYTYFHDQNSFDPFSIKFPQISRQHRPLFSFYFGQTE